MYLTNLETLEPFYEIILTFTIYIVSAEDFNYWSKLDSRRREADRRKGPCLQYPSVMQGVRVKYR